jgi:hypothetical protein
MDYNGIKTYGVNSIMKKLINKFIIDKLVQMDNDVRTYSLLGYFLVFEFFIFFFTTWWLMFLPFIFIYLIIYTGNKAEELEKSKQKNESF